MCIALVKHHDITQATSVPIVRFVVVVVGVIRCGGYILQVLYRSPHLSLSSRIFAAIVTTARPLLPSALKRLRWTFYRESINPSADKAQLRKPTSHFM